ncbi:MAG: peptidoglycan editing factor PgeF [Ectothiorhodospira sp.]
MPEPLIIEPRWPAPAGVRAVVTTRDGGVSRPPYDALNLALHTGDDPEAVRENRRRLVRALDLPAAPAWLEQVHGTAVAEASGVIPDATQADASIARGPGVVCAVLTADCLPVCLCDRAAGEVAVAHAGWRGLASGVLEAAVAAFSRPPEDLLAWLGPAIGPAVFEVGPEVRRAFVEQDPETAVAFVSSRGDRWFADLHALARARLQACGVAEVHGLTACTHGEAERFFSYRRDGRTGRMATLIWRE